MKGQAKKSVQKRPERIKKEALEGHRQEAVESIDEPKQTAVDAKSTNEEHREGHQAEREPADPKPAREPDDSTVTETEVSEDQAEEPLEAGESVTQAEQDADKALTAEKPGAETRKASETAASTGTDDNDINADSKVCEVRYRKTGDGKVKLIVGRGCTTEDVAEILEGSLRIDEAMLEEDPEEAG